MNQRELIEKTIGQCDLPENKEFARQASIQEAKSYANRDRKPYVMYPAKSRLEEVTEFSRKNGVQEFGCGLL